MLLAYNGFGEAIYGVYSSRIEGFNAFKLGRQGIIVEVPELNLMPSDYSIGVWINSRKQVQDDIITKALKIEVTQDMNLTGHAVDYTRYKDYGILSRSKWKSA
jgi:hypothetical protein